MSRKASPVLSDRQILKRIQLGLIPILRPLGFEALAGGIFRRWESDEEQWRAIEFQPRLSKPSLWSGQQLKGFLEIQKTWHSHVWHAGMSADEVEQQRLGMLTQADISHFLDSSQWAEYFTIVNQIRAPKWERKEGQFVRVVGGEPGDQEYYGFFEPATTQVQPIFGAEFDVVQEQDVDRWTEFLGRCLPQVVQKHQIAYPTIGG